LSASTEAGAGAGPAATDAGAPSGYGRSAAILSLGIGVTGLVTYSYFSLASHFLSEADYGRITVLWSAIYVVIGVLYRPVEQLLSHSIADAQARGNPEAHQLRVAAGLQLGLGVAFAAAALIFRGPIEDDLLGGSSRLYWIFVVAVLAYAASYFARGFLAGNRRFGLYGGLVLMEAVSRCLFAVAVAVGIAEGQSVVALGMAAAPIVSLAVVPPALVRMRARRRGAARQGVSVAAPTVARGSTDEPLTADAAAAAEPSAETARVKETEFTLSQGTGFAAAVLVVMLCEQTIINAGPLVVKSTEGAAGAALAGFVFNALLVARAPLQLFQAVQTSILPHLTRLRAGGEQDPFRRSVNLTLMAIAGFAAVVTLVMAAVGPTLMDIFFGGEVEYARGGLVLVALGMGFYLASATLNQAALAQGRAARAAGCWSVSAGSFVAYLLVLRPDDRVLQVEAGFLGAALVLCGLLYAVYRVELGR